MTVTINGTTGVAVPLGSAGAPGVSNTTSATTGIYNPTSTTLGLSTNGTQAVYVDASQNVGIGTSSTGAGYRISVVGSAASSVPLYLHSDATNGYVYSSNPLVMGSTGAYSCSLVTNNTIQMTIASSGIITGTAGNLMLVSGTAQASTSGTSIDFTSIPSWVKRVTINFSGVSTNGSSLVQVQIGSGSIVTTGYSSGASSGATANTSTTGFLATSNMAAANSITGTMVVNLLTGNSWVCFGVSYYTGVGAALTLFSGSISLSGTLDRVRITTVNGTDTFDAGTINIMYE